MRKIVFSLFATCMLLGVVACGGGEKSVEQLLKRKGEGIDYIKGLVESGGVSAKDDEGYTALSLALTHGHSDLAKALIREGADVHDKVGYYGYGFTMLMCAADDIEVTQMILDKGVNVNDNSNGMGTTALMSAASSGNVEIVKLLLAKGADVNLVDYDGDTALSLTSDSEIEGLLRAAGAIDMQEQLAKVSAILAKMKGKRGVTEMQALVDTGNINKMDEEGRTSLMWAARYGYLDIVNILIECGVNVSMGDVDGNTSLMRASYNGHLDVVKALIAAGVDLESKDDDGMTALGLAYKFNRSASADLLKAAGAIEQANPNINKVDSEGNTPLMRAINSKNISEVRSLIEQGADVNFLAQYEDDWTYISNALDAAVSSGNIEIARILLENGAKIDVALWDGEEEYTVLSQVCGYYRNPQMLKLLMDYGANADFVFNGKYGQKNSVGSDAVTSILRSAGL